MKHAVICIFLSMMLSSPALAVLRPRYPVKPTPPFRGHVIVIEDSDAIQTGRPKLGRCREIPSQIAKLEKRATRPKNLSVIGGGARESNPRHH
jgi:hypothetical protein